MNDKCMRQLAYWLANNVDIETGMPKIFDDPYQEELEKYMKGE